MPLYMGDRMTPSKPTKKPVPDERLDRIEQAIVTLNHASEKLLIWQAEVSADLKWLKYLVGAGAAAGLFSAIAEIIKTVVK